MSTILTKRRCRLDSSRVCVCAYLCVHVYVCVSYDVLVCVSTCLFVYLSLCLCVYVSVSLCFSVFACCMQLSDGEMQERGRGGGRGTSWDFPKCTNPSPNGSAICTWTMEKKARAKAVEEGGSKYWPSVRYQIFASNCWLTSIHTHRDNHLQYRCSTR